MGVNYLPFIVVEVYFEPVPGDSLCNNTSIRDRSIARPAQQYHPSIPSISTLFAQPFFFDTPTVLPLLPVVFEC